MLITSFRIWTWVTDFIFYDDNCYTKGDNPSSVMTNELECSLQVGKFELQSCYYVDFHTNTLERAMNPLIPQVSG